MTLLLDLADAARKSGLKVVELPNWKGNLSPGGFDPHGVLCHHTGSFDGIADPADDLTYAKWLAFTGRSDLPPPLCNLALSAEGVVYVCASGNANHAGQARASGPMPAAPDGNVLYVGIEAMNSGSQGWRTMGVDAAGNPITQYEAYVRLCAALCLHYKWPASHVRAHKETSVTGKIDPAPMDMDKFRTDVAAKMKEMVMPKTVILVMNEKDTLATNVAVSDLRAVVEQHDPDLGVLNEWNRTRDHRTRKMLARRGYGYARPTLGGGPVFWRKSRFRKKSIKSRVLSLPGFVGKLPGRRSFLSTSWLTVAQFLDADGTRVVLDGFHMTAEVQKGLKYRTDVAHAKRVARHRHEKQRVEDIAQRQKANGGTVYPAGDSNFDRMRLAGFVNCWEGHDGGDLGGRAVTQCFATGPAVKVQTEQTQSDHLAVVVTY